MGQQRGGCVWLETTHLEYSSKALYAAGTEQGAEKEQSLPTRPSSSRGRGRQSSNTNTMCQERPLQEDPRNTNQAGQEHCCLSITEVCCRPCQKNKTLIYRTTHISHLNCTQRKWELDKENPCLMSSTEPWLTPNPGTWHPNKLNPVRRMGNGRGSLKGSSPDQTCSHHWTAGWLSGLWWSSPWLSYSGKVTETRERYRESDFCSNSKSVWEHSKMEYIFIGSCVVSGWAGRCLKAGL